MFLSKIKNVRSRYCRNYKKQDKVRNASTQTINHDRFRHLKRQVMTTAPYLKLFFKGIFPLSLINIFSI